MPEEVDECAKSIMEDNPEMDESVAFAICQDMKNKGELGPSGVVRTESDDDAPVIRTHGNRELAGADIQRKEADGRDPEGAVRYTDVTLLAPGEWTDSTSRTTFFYSPEGIARSADNWADNDLHLNHDGEETILADIGYIDTETAHANEQGELVADIVFHRRTDQSRNAEELMALTLETEGRQGIGGPSVEIVDTKDEWDEDRGVYETVEMTFSGAGLVTRPASETVAFSEQLARAHSAEGVKVQTMHKTKSQDTQGEDRMSDIKTLSERLARSVRTLQSEEELMALTDLLESFMASMDDAGDMTLAEMREWVGENVDEEAQMLAESMIDAYLADHGGDMDTTTVAEFDDWANELLAETEMEDGEDDDEEEEEMDMESDDEGDEEEDKDMGKRLSAMEERIEELETELSDTEEELADTKTELSGVKEETEDLRILGSNIDNVADALERVERELAEVRDEENTRSLADARVNENNELVIPYRGNGR